MPRRPLFKLTVARHGDLAELLAGCDAIAAYNGDNHLPLLWRFYRSHRAVLFRLARTVAFDATTTDRALLGALQVLLAHEDANGDWLPAGVEVHLSFASEQWQRTIIARVDGRRRITRRHFEVCVFSNLATGLKSGDIAIRGSEPLMREHFSVAEHQVPAIDRALTSRRGRQDGWWDGVPS